MDWPKHVVTGKPLSKDSQNGKVYAYLIDHEEGITRNDAVKGTILKINGWITFVSSYRLSARVWDLIHQYGVSIESEPVRKNGRIADYIYRLVEES